MQLQYTNDFINQNLNSAESTESLLHINSYLSFFLLYCTEQLFNLRNKIINVLTALLSNQAAVFAHSIVSLSSITGCDVNLAGRVFRLSLHFLPHRSLSPWTPKVLLALNEQVCIKTLLEHVSVICVSHVRGRGEMPNEGDIYLKRLLCGCALL